MGFLPEEQGQHKKKLSESQEAQQKRSVKKGQPCFPGYLDRDSSYKLFSIIISSTTFNSQNHVLLSQFVIL